MITAMLMLKLKTPALIQPSKVTKDNKTSIKHFKESKPTFWTLLKKMMSCLIVNQKEASDVDVKINIMRRLTMKTIMMLLKLLNLQ